MISSPPLRPRTANRPASRLGAVRSTRNHSAAEVSIKQNRPGSRTPAPALDGTLYFYQMYDYTTSPVTLQQFSDMQPHVNDASTEGITGGVPQSPLSFIERSHPRGPSPAFGRLPEVAERVFIGSDRPRCLARTQYREIGTATIDTLWRPLMTGIYRESIATPHRATPQTKRHDVGDDAPLGCRREILPAGRTERKRALLYGIGDTALTSLFCIPITWYSYHISPDISLRFSARAYSHADGPVIGAAGLLYSRVISVNGRPPLCAAPTLPTSLPLDPLSRVRTL
ncbi:hypothetical protein EVAR_19709_1 [Eumeta japonica]|uniref:Uncharacterized protein n=1 Tax=Eumeta variegata TaxID=151549 RepID=A0A4C1UQE6_EUMVA|nr:hypothetical protein EVAR_19709_1 [Eumeta japonica]